LLLTYVFIRSKPKQYKFFFTRSNSKTKIPINENLDAAKEATLDLARCFSIKEENSNTYERDP